MYYHQIILLVSQLTPGNVKLANSHLCITHRSASDDLFTWVLASSLDYRGFSQFLQSFLLFATSSEKWLLLFSYRALQSSSMDINTIPTPPLNCFICEGPESPAQKLAQLTKKGYPTLSAYAQVTTKSARASEVAKGSSQMKRRSTCAGLNAPTTTCSSTSPQSVQLPYTFRMHSLQPARSSLSKKSRDWQKETVVMMMQCLEA